MFRKSFLFLLIVFSLIGCENKDSIKIGYSGSLIGNYSHLGIGGRNGAMLAVETINNQGGINGRKLELLAEDDQDSPDIAVKVDRKLIKNGAIAIIGHISSTVTLKAVTENPDILYISPTASSTVFTDKDDLFFRIQSDYVSQAKEIGNFIAKRKNIKKFLIAYDNTNPVYTVPFVNIIKTNFNSGDKQIQTYGFAANTYAMSDEIAKDIKDYNPDAICFIAPGDNVALIIIELKKYGYKGLILTSGSSRTFSFLTNGREYVEGTIVFDSGLPYDEDNVKYTNFVKNYKHRFGIKPNFASVNSYIAVFTLSKAIKGLEDYSPENIKRRLLSIDSYDIEGVKFKFTKYGDIILKPRVYIVKNGHFVKYDENIIKD